MTKARRLQSRSAAMRTGLTVIGLAIIAISPVIGAIPGPGGVFVFAGGLALVLQNSAVAKRHFVRLKRRWPKIGLYADLGLRRGSARRRFERDRPIGADGKKLSGTAMLRATIRDTVRGRGG